MLESYLCDARFDRYILSAENSPDALDWPSLTREWPRAMSAPDEVSREELLPLLHAYSAACCCRR